MSNNDYMADNSDDAAQAKLAQALAALPRELTPEKDLWPDLAQKLAPRERTKSGPLWIIAATLAAVVMTYWLVPIPSSTPEFANIAASNLSSIYEQEKSSQIALIPVSTPNIERQIAIWEQAIAQVENALLYYPDQGQLITQLNHLHQQQLHYLRELSQQPPQIAALY